MELIAQNQAGAHPPTLFPQSLSAALAAAREGEVADVLMRATFKPRLPGEWVGGWGGGYCFFSCGRPRRPAWDGRRRPF